MGETAFFVNKPRAPVVYLGGRGCQHSFRRASSAVISSSVASWPCSPQMRSTRPGMSTWIRSPSSTRAMGPPSAASGDTWPMAGPLLAPEKRPSVMSAIEAESSGSEEMASVV